MQNRDGGWGAFDRDNDCAVLTQVPFADHNAMIDPSSADVTARVLECLAYFGRTADDPFMARGLEYLRSEQASDGSWYGRWGVNYIYGSSGGSAGGPGAEDRLVRLVSARRGVAAQRSNRDGGFGETCDSYANPRDEGTRPSTPSQSAWAIIGLLAAGKATDLAVVRAVEYLLDSQDASGAHGRKRPRRARAFLRCSI